MTEYSEIVYQAYEDIHNPSIKYVPIIAAKPGNRSKGLQASLKKMLPLGHRMRNACPEIGCYADLELRNSKHGFFYGCVNYPDCPGAHSAHQDTGQPVGTPAPLFTRQLRRQGHKLLEMLITKKKTPSKKTAYRWLADKLEITPDKCHFGLFDEFMCERAVYIMKKELKICDVFQKNQYQSCK